MRCEWGSLCGPGGVGGSLDAAVAGQRLIVVDAPNGAVLDSSAVFSLCSLAWVGLGLGLLRNTEASVSFARMPSHVARRASSRGLCSTLNEWELTHTRVYVGAVLGTHSGDAARHEEALLRGGHPHRAGLLGQPRPSRRRLLAGGERFTLRLGAGTERTERSAPKGAERRAARTGDGFRN